MKSALLLTAALVVGGAVGAAAAVAYMEPRIADAEERLSDARAEKQRLETQLETMEASTKDLQRQVARLETQFEAYQQRTSAAARPAATDASPSYEAAQAPGEDLENLFSELADRLQAAPSAAGSAGVVAGEDAETEEDAEREARREEWRQNMANRFRDMAQMRLENAYAAAQTPEDRERVGLMEEQLVQMTELWEQARQAETPEERREAFGEIRQAFQSLNALSEAHQDSVLRHTMGEYGITDPERQQQLLNEIRQAYEAGSILPGMGRGRGGFGGRGGGR
jgi:uncharacterized protein YlxW (UPF0749 family)